MLYPNSKKWGWGGGHVPHPSTSLVLTCLDWLTDLRIPNHGRFDSTPTRNSRSVWVNPGLLRDMMVFVYIDRPIRCNIMHDEKISNDQSIHVVIVTFG